MRYISWNYIYQCLKDSLKKKDTLKKRRFKKKRYKMLLTKLSKNRTVILHILKIIKR